MVFKTLFSIYQYVAESIADAAGESAGIESELLCMAAFGLTKTQLLVRFHDPLTDFYSSKEIVRLIKRIHQFIQKRQTGMPVPYILGVTDFRHHQYQVWPGVLIPRPETELLVENCIEIIRQYDKKQSVAILELGYGSGVIGIELSAEFPSIPVYGWDISQKAFALANQNAEAIGVSNTHFYKGDFFKAQDTWMDIVRAYDFVLLVSNPPYIPTNDLKELDASVRLFEPMQALNGGSDGLRYYKKLFKMIGDLTNSTVCLACEIGIHQQSDLEKLAARFGYKAAFQKDYQGILRIMTVKTKPIDDLKSIFVPVPER